MDFLRSKRGKIIIITGIVLIAAALVLSGILLSSQKGYRNINVTEIAGTVTVSVNGKEYSAYENMRVSDGYSLTTLIASYIRLALDNDKFVKLDEDSKAVFTKVGNSRSKNTQIELEYGTLTTEITKPLLKDESYVVNTPNSVLAVRGTLYKVCAGKDKNGVEYTDIYTYGGSVAAKRIRADGTVIDETVIVNAGYKTRIMTSGGETVYVEEYAEETGDNVDPIDPKQIPDEDLVIMYEASQSGHEMFMKTEEIQEEIRERSIDLADYRSFRDGKSAIDAGDTYSAGIPTDVPAAAPSSGGTSADGTSAAETTSEALTETSETSVPTEISALTETAAAETTVTTVQTETETETTVTASAETTTETETETETETTTEVVFVTMPPSSPATTPATTTTAETTTTTVTTTVSEETETTVCTHNWRKISDGMAATCTEDGIGAVYKCSKCGETSGGDVIPALGHSYVTKQYPDGVVGPGYAVSPATCTEPATAVYPDRYCERCGKGYSVTEGEPLGHDWTDVPAREATCTAVGYNTHQACSRCQEKIGYVEIPALGHDWETIVTKEASATEHGERTTRCKHAGCNEYSTEVIHFSSLVDYRAATCKEAGYQKARCEVPSCGELYMNEVIPINPNNHPAYAALTGTSPNPEATCTEEGRIATKECIECHEWIYETIPIDPDNHIDANGDLLCDRCGIGLG